MILFIGKGMGKGEQGNGGMGSGLDTFIEEDPCIASWQWKLFFVGHIV